MGWINLDEFAAFGVTIQGERVESVVSAVLLFLVVSHVIQWRGDYLSYRGWNVIGRQPASMRSIEGTKEQTKLDAIAEDSREVAEKDAVTKAGLVQMQSYLDRMRREMTAFASFAWFYVWIWYLAFPLVAAVGVLVWWLYA
ncbi:hypothetical protein [Alkalilacustris brevis]|uniref:hypothetical protein n=1 Tax=Alkalilacustris brevis TaxID=2026338 RepID=UPI0012D2C937|nr:hypothetical protein [Alkalilacustris brevis]